MRSIYALSIAASLAMLPTNLASLPITQAISAPAVVESDPADPPASAQQTDEFSLVSATSSILEAYLLIDIAELAGMAPMTYEGKTPLANTHSEHSVAAFVTPNDKCLAEDAQCAAFIAGAGPGKGIFRVALPDGAEQRITRFQAWREMRCLAYAAWAEARSEGRDGMLAVMQVIVNRTIADGHPENICAVVSQKGQFDAMLGKKARPWLSAARHAERMVPAFSSELEGPDSTAAHGALALAWRLLTGQIGEDMTNGATFFATVELIEDRGSDIIAPNLEQAAVVGDHVFLRPADSPARTQIASRR